MFSRFDRYIAVMFMLNGALFAASLSPFVQCSSVAAALSSESSDDSSADDSLIEKNMDPFKYGWAYEARGTDQKMTAASGALIRHTNGDVTPGFDVLICDIGTDRKKIDSTIEEFKEREFPFCYMDGKGRMLLRQHLSIDVREIDLNTVTHRWLVISAALSVQAHEMLEKSACKSALDPAYLVAQRLKGNDTTCIVIDVDEYKKSGLGREESNKVEEAHLVIDIPTISVDRESIQGARQPAREPSFTPFWVRWFA